MLGKLLGKGKKKRASDDPLAAIELDDSIDLESGTIYIDDSIDPDRVVATTDVFDQTSTDAAPKRLASAGGRIFLLDLAPFFRAIGTKKGERAAATFVRFCENWLARAVGGAGAYELVRGETFFFRLNLPPAEAGPKAVEIINSIGTQYLRDAFKPELVFQILGAVDADKAMRDGRIDAARAWDALGQWRSLDHAAREKEFAEGWSRDRTDNESVMELRPIQAGRPASQRVVRGPARRQAAGAAHTGPERRWLKHGRRATDKPAARKGVWS